MACAVDVEPRTAHRDPSSPIAMLDSRWMDPALEPHGVVLVGQREAILVGGIGVLHAGLIVRLGDELEPPQEVQFGERQ